MEDIKQEDNVQGNYKIITLTFLSLCGDVNLNQVHGRPERSPDIFVDGAESVAAGTDRGRKLFALAVKNQDGDNTSSRLDGYSQQISEDGGDGPRENGDILAISGEGLSGPVVAKRFSEFIGKRNGLRQDKAIVDSEDGGVNLVLGSLQRVGQEQQENNMLDKGMTDSRALTNLMGGLYNELPEGDVSKREYEFVGKRNYDFVGKKRYHFLGKRNQDDFIGKRYDFLGKRYDFLGKRSPYEFVGKKSYDFLGKRSPYEFVGKRRQDNNGVESSIRISPSSPAGELKKIYFNSMSDLPLESAQIFGVADKRYSEFLGKRKRNEEHEESSLSNSERLAALLQDNGLRKRLSRMLLNRSLDDSYPGFIGK